MQVAPVGYSNGGGFGWGGDFGSWIILFLLFGLFGGWGGYGFGGNGGGINSPAGQGWATRADINEGFALNNLQSGINSIQTGLCDSTYTLTNAINNGFHGVDTAVCNLGYQTQAGINSLGSQLASCCCDVREAIQGVNYNMATQSSATQNIIQNSTRDIIDNQNSNARAVLDALNQNYIRSLESENQSLKLAASQSAQNATLMAAMDANTAELLRRTGHDCPTPAYVVQPPAPVTFPNFACSACG